MSENCQILEGGKRTCRSGSTRVEGDHICASSGRRGHTQLVRTASLLSNEDRVNFPKVSSSRNLQE
jgi:hypothetical protein